MERFDTQRGITREVARLISLFESERRFFEEMITLLPVPVATFDSAGALLSANHAFLRAFSLNREQADRETIAGLFPDTDCAGLLDSHRAIEASIGKWQATFTPIPRWESGETEWMASFQKAEAPATPAAPKVDPEMVAAGAGVEAAQRLAARVTHEANNLIMIAAGYGREILDKLPEGSEMRGDMNTLLDATGRIESMAAQLNEFSRTGRGEIGVHALRDVLPASAAPPPEIGGIPVRTDRQALEAVFGAWTALAGVPLTLEAQATESEVQVHVRGFGLSAENLRQQFEALNKAAREGQAGAREAALTGPRLARAGVRWKVTPEAALSLAIPRADAAERPPAAPRAALVVDDEAGIRTLVRRILEGQGFSVEEAGSGEEAVALLERRTQPLPLLVTDMRMPGMTGRDLADRARYFHPNVRILFVSGFTDDPGVQSGILPERSRFLSKPFHPGDLVKAVTNLLEETPPAAP